MSRPLPLSTKPQASATDYLMVSKRCEILSLEAFLRRGRLVAVISNLVHALQRERGTSNLYLGAAGQRYGDHLMDAVTETDQQALRFQAALGELNTEANVTHGDSRLFSRVAYAVHALSETDGLRVRVRAQALTPEITTKIYSELVHGLLVVVFETADTAGDPSLSRILVAMFNFMQGKELAGQERAAGAAGFAMGHFDTGLTERMSHLAEAQERCFEVFADFADGPSFAAWRALDESSDQAELDRLRRMAYATAAQRPRSSRVDNNLGDRWFWLASARIDAMKSVEDLLERRLHQLCEEKLREARQELVRHRSQVQEVQELLQQKDAPADSFIVFCDQASEGGQQDSYRSDGVGPGLGRSIIELVQSQSHRLQTMNDELNAAREALEERKMLDRAKALLMKHRRMSEEEAYRLLRQTAMNQSRRLVDVARAMVAVGDVWTRSNEGKTD